MMFAKKLIVFLSKTRQRKYYNFIRLHISLPALFGCAYIQMSGAKQLRRKEKKSARRRRKNKMENNTMEMNLNEMEMANLEKVSGGYIVENFKTGIYEIIDDKTGDVLRFIKGMKIWDVKDIATRVYNVTDEYINRQQLASLRANGNIDGIPREEFELLAD